MELILPSIQYKEAYLDALKESKNETSTTKLSEPEDGQSFEAFVQKLLDMSAGKNLPEGYVPATDYWLIDDREVIGRVNVRHELTEKLLRRGGNIGYYIKPSKRGMGYGKKILELALIEAKKLGLSKVLITCDDDNSASCSIIESNGGVLENIIPYEEEGKQVRRYWIE